MRRSFYVLSSLLVLATWSHGQCELGQAEGYDNPDTERFGTSVAVDGDLAAVGDWFFEDDGTGTGFVYLYRRSGVEWLREAILDEPTGTDPEAFSTYFGDCVDVSGDRVIVSAPGHDGVGSEAGRAHVFRRGASGWLLEGTLFAPVPANGDRFGAYVALDGDLALVSGERLGWQAMPPELFRFQGGEWRAAGSLHLPRGTFGGDVALEGQRLLVGGNDPLGTPTVFVFREDASGWTYEAQLPSSGLADYDGYGESVALADPYAIVGAHGADGIHVNQGVAYVWRRSGQSWSRDELLWAPDGSQFDRFGKSVDLDGEVAVVGAWFDRDVPVGQGSAYAFQRSGSGWLATAKLTPSAFENDQRFGWAVALSEGTAWVGAPSWDSGRAFIHAVSGPDCNRNGELDACDVASGSSHDFDGDGTPDECQPLSADTPSVSLGTPGVQTLTLAAGPDLAGSRYLLVGSATGTSPGLAVGGHLLPLVPDAYFLATLLAPNQPPLANSLAVLDGTGAATASFSPPAGLSPALAGTTLFHAYTVVSSGALVLTSNPMPVLLVP